MSYYAFEERFEEGTKGAFDSEAGGISYVYVGDQVGVPGGVIPWQGAYMVKVTGAGTGDDSLVEGDYNISADSSIYQKMLLYFPSDDLSLGTGETFDIFVAESTGDDEGSIRVRNNSGTYEIGVWSDLGTGGTGTPSEAYGELPLDRWFQLELLQTDATGSAGILTMWIDDAQIATVNDLTNAAITTATWGYQDGSNAGNSVVYYLDHIKWGTSARLGGKEVRWPSEVRVTDSRHVFVGPGHVDSVELVDGGSGDSTVTLYDTDAADISEDRKVGRLETASAGDMASLPTGIRVTKGLYVQLGGTSTQAYVRLGRVAAYGSEGSVKTYVRGL